MICAISAAMAQEATDSTTVKRYQAKVGDFTRLDVENSFNIDYGCSSDSAGYAVYYTTPAWPTRSYSSTTTRANSASRSPSAPPASSTWGCR